MKILIAEDTTDLNRVVTVMLQRFGYDVDSVFDGEAALECVDRNGYDAVILDIMMPKSSPPRPRWMTVSQASTPAPTTTFPSPLP